MLGLRLHAQESDEIQERVKKAESAGLLDWIDEEGYLMEIKDIVTVQAEEATGAFWATRTILQALKSGDMTTIPQGITAMLNYDPEATAEDNAVTMDMAAQGVSTGSITFAARNSDFEGHKIKRGDILAMDNGKLSFVEKDVEKATIKLAKQMMKRDSSFITIIYGEGVTAEEAEKVAEEVQKRAPKNAEVSVLEGNQPVYYYFISVE